MVPAVLFEIIVPLVPFEIIGPVVLFWPAGLGWAAASDRAAESAGF
ncbi:hypothetical protein BLSMQ_1218 [Brevibacterium aurantiacum]|uniref:Uncharacterized protein n=1 Tax=Brevibacterium aurantiacum TaxID=273384 RepID=A0A1D7W2N4_BREAU|nr:hypothetical protein BLSMQ_1218 [Brevibacterium aurantiacum]